MRAKWNPYLVGIIGFGSMILFYYVLLTLTTGDPMHPFIFFSDKWYFLAPLFLGFGFQMYLFQRLRIVVHENSLKMAGTSAGVSGVAMVACCAHHLAEIFPLVGFMGIATVLTKYQDLFLAFGVSINIAGIAYMWLKLKQHTDMACCKNHT